MVSKLSCNENAIEVESIILRWVYGLTIAHLMTRGEYLKEL
jgi:hypothetical protein